MGNNAASDSTTITGTTDVADGTFHYIVWSYRNNYSQLYVDGVLEASGYTVTPTYAATNYVKIGCGNVTGTNNNWLNGAIDDLFIINGYALDEKTIKAQYDAATAQGTSDITVTKYFLVTSSTLAGSHTHVTLYGGTDYALADATISNAYYSTQKAPFGFPMGKDKWTVYSTNDGTTQTQATPTAGVWYNKGGSISVPIGSWDVAYRVLVAFGDASAQAANVAAGLGLTNATAIDSTKAAARMYVAAGGNAGSSLTGNKVMTAPSKTSMYLNIMTPDSSIDNIYVLSTATTGAVLDLRATSTLL